MGAPPVTNVIEKARRVLANKSVAVFAAVLALVIAAAVFIGPRLLAEPPVEISYSEFTRDLASKKVQKVLIESGGLSVSTSDRNVFVRMPNGLVSADYIE